MAAANSGGNEVELLLPTLARRAQDMARGTGNWKRVAEAVLDEFILPLDTLSFAALERTRPNDPFTTVVSHELPLLTVGKVGPRSTIASFVEAAATPGKVVVSQNIAGAGALACVTLSSDADPLHLIVLAGRTPSVTPGALNQFATQLFELLRPAAGGHAARAPADVVSLAIRHAKREWEMVADGLPGVVGLADASGQVLRINRSWTRVPGKGLGQSIHSLLHPRCDNHDCRFSRTLKSALKLITVEQKVIIRTRDEKRDAAWNVYLRHIPAHAGRSARVIFSITEAPAAAVVADAVALTRPEQELSGLLDRHRFLLDEQRREFAGELQRSVGQSLASARRGLEWAIETLRKEPGVSVLGELERSLAVLDGVARDAADVPDFPAETGLESVGLAKSLRALCADWVAAGAGRDVQVDCVVDDRNVPKPLWLTIFRIVHEALHGVARSARIGTIGITMVPGDRALLLAIEHVGVDFVPVPAVGLDSPGMLLMRELAEFSGGTFRAEFIPDGGTTVEVLWSRLAAVSRVDAPKPVH